METQTHRPIIKPHQIHRLLVVARSMAQVDRTEIDSRHTCLPAVVSLAISGVTDEEICLLLHEDIEFALHRIRIPGRMGPKSRVAFTDPIFDDLIEFLAWKQRVGRMIQPRGRLFSTPEGAAFTPLYLASLIRDMGLAAELDFPDGLEFRDVQSLWRIHSYFIE